MGDKAIRQNIKYYEDDNLKFITYKILKPYATQNNLEDLKQAVMLGISKAVKTFKNNKGSSFYSWAYLKVRKEVQLCKNQEYLLSCSPQTRQRLAPEIHIGQIIEQADTSSTLRYEPEIPELLIEFFKVNIGLSRYMNITIDNLVHEIPILLIAKKYRKSEKQITNILTIVKQAFKDWYARSRV